MSVGAISHMEILAWSILTGNRLRRWEVKAITRLDRLYRRIASED